MNSSLMRDVEESNGRLTGDRIEFRRFADDDGRKKRSIEMGV